MYLITSRKRLQATKEKLVAKWIIGQPVINYTVLEYRFEFHIAGKYKAICKDLVGPNT